MFFGAAGAGVAVSFFTFVLSGFLTSGEAPGLAGDPVGDGTGDGSGLATVTGVGVAAGLFGTSGFGSQAPRTATLAAKTVDKINDLLMINLLKWPSVGHWFLTDEPSAGVTNAAGMMPNVFPQMPGLYPLICRSSSTLRWIERAVSVNLQEYFWVVRQRMRKPAG